MCHKHYGLLSILNEKVMHFLRQILVFGQVENEAILTLKHKMYCLTRESNPEP